ncbi:oleate hydratase, partial [Micrococcus sp. GbtcB5]|uniref:oleate hydratase n=1 Tax=Micrococcus sp. GbtcB5 TaxID=2824750 RepID=UPI001C3079B8
VWDLFRTIPPLEVEGSVLAEFYWPNKADPNYSLNRVTHNRGEEFVTNSEFGLSEKAQKEMVRVFLASREEMEDKRIDEVFGEDFLDSKFWLYWRTMFAFENWHSALGMKLYLQRSPAPPRWARRS